jgi:glucokinase
MSDETPEGSVLVLAVDVGGTKVESALVDARPAILPGTRFRATTGGDADSDGLARAVTSVIRRSMAAAPAHATVIGAGIGSAGPISTEDGTVSPLNLAAWRRFPLRELVQTASGLTRVTLRLDGLCITLAEHWAGALSGYRTAMGMVVSTGIGGGIIADGRFLGGNSGNAGHVGQIQVRSRMTKTGADHAATLEGVAAGPRIVGWARAGGWTGRSGQDLARDYHAGDPIAIAAVDRSAQAIGEGIASTCALLDLQAVAIGGGFAQVAPDFIERVQAAATDAAALSTIDVRILPAALASDAPLIGAAGLIHRAELLPAG